jgi:ATP/maltotriose-dependent transcriptional regulator MalT
MHVLWSGVITNQDRGTNNPFHEDQLYLSVNTVKTHMRHVYDKLGAHRRHEAVEQARALGLLAPAARRP